jgi:hypothetical protein
MKPTSGTLLAGLALCLGAHRASAAWSLTIDNSDPSAPKATFSSEWSPEQGSLWASGILTFHGRGLTAQFGNASGAVLLTAPGSSQVVALLRLIPNADYINGSFESSSCATFSSDVAFWTGYGAITVALSSGSNPITSLGWNSTTVTTSSDLNLTVVVSTP